MEKKVQGETKLKILCKAFAAKITLLIGYDTGKKTNRSSRTKVDSFAPRLSPYREQTA
jgi:hypothetical protein